MTQDEIIAAISAVLALSPPHVAWDKMTEKQRAENKQQEKTFDFACGNLCERLRQADTDTVFEVLFPLACASRGGHFYAHILLYLKVPCQLSCKEAVRRLSQSEWDVSLEEVPWYLVDRFGAEAVYQSVNELEQEDEIQEYRNMEAAWSAVHFWQGMRLQEYMKAEEARPRNSVDARLLTVRYWTDILVKDQKGILENWHPFWWRSKSSTD